MASLFKGRINRRIFIVNYLLLLSCFLVVVQLLNLVAKWNVILKDNYMLVFLSVFFIAFIFLLSLTAKRLHDIGLPTILSLLLLIPVVTPFLFLFLLLKRGQPGINQYGNPQSPKKIVIPLGFWKIGFFIELVIVLILGGIALRKYFLFSLIPSAPSPLPSISLSPTPSSSNQMELKIQKSNLYSLDWDEFTKTATLKENKTIKVEFNLPEKPFQVIIHKPSGTLALVTTEDGKLNSPHNLYLYSANKISKKYTGFSDTKMVNAKTYFYDFWEEEDQYINNDMSNVYFSPDGKYLLANVFLYEGSIPIVCSVEDGKQCEEIENEYFVDIDNFFWSPDSQCILNYSSRGVPTVFLGKRVNSKYIFISLDHSTLGETDQENIFEGGKQEVFWTTECKGLIRKNQNSNDYYQFSYKDGNVQKIAQPILTSYQESLKTDQETIFLTIEKNSN